MQSFTLDQIAAYQSLLKAKSVMITPSRNDGCTLPHLRDGIIVAKMGAVQPAFALPLLL